MKNNSRQAGVLNEPKITFTTPPRIVLATTAALWMGGLQAQSPVPPTVRGASEIRFRDFFRAPVGPAGLEISDTLRRADGSAVRLVGYMVQQERAPAGRFLLTPRPVQMSQHADGEADDLPPAAVAVYLDPSQKDWVVPHVRGLVAVSGVLAVGRHEEQDGRVSWVRLQLAADGARSMAEPELADLRNRPMHQH
jgi:hypothetical protein